MGASSRSFASRVATLVALTALIACDSVVTSNPNSSDDAKLKISRVVVMPSSANLAPGQSIQLVASPRDYAGHVIAGEQVAWRSTDGSIASISSTGLLTAHQVGEVVVTASGGLVSQDVTIFIEDEPTASVSVSPAIVDVLVGETVQIAAAARDSTGAIIADRPVFWYSSNSSVATASSTGLIRARGTGSAVLTASSGDATRTVSVNVTLPPVAEAQLEEMTVNLQVFDTRRLNLQLRDAEGAAITGRTVEWSSSKPSVATVSPSGLVGAVALGTATISARVDGVNVSAVVNVIGGTEARPRVSPQVVEPLIGDTVQMSAVLIDAAGEVVPNAHVEWSIADTSIARISDMGVVVAKAGGETDITTVIDGRKALARLRVIAGRVATVTIEPSSPTLTVGGRLQLTAIAKNALGAVLTGRAVKFTSTSGKAMITQSGMVTAVLPGTATISAYIDGEVGRTTVTITQAPVASVAVSPNPTSLKVGGSTRLSAQTRDAAGTTLDDRPVSWSSSAPAVAVVSTSGYVTAVGSGSTQIVATSESASGTAGVSVSTPVTVPPANPPSPPPAPIPVASVTVAPATATVAIGATQQLSATLRDANGATLTGKTVAWTRSSTSVLSVSTNGLVTALAAGMATVTATSEGRSGTATITVPAPPTAPPTAPPPPPPTLPPSGSGECASPRAGWIFCDDFDVDRLGSYFEVDNNSGDFVRTASIGINGSSAMRARWQAGEVNAGSLHLAFGRTPSSYFRPSDAGTANYREIYWRLYVRFQPGWQGGGADKLTRAIVFANANWAEAAIGHLWSGSGSAADYLQVDPASGTDASGALRSTKYNDFANFRWLGERSGTTPVFGAGAVGQWQCIEARMRLNDAGHSNGVLTSWINGVQDASSTGLNFVGSYSAYGINALFVENYWNSGSPVQQERYLDNLVVSTEPIGCGSVPTPPPPAPPTLPPAVATVSVAPSSATVSISATRQLAATLRDAAGNTLTGRTISWTSASSSVASVSNAGLVTAHAAGSATITATSEGRTGTATITVPAPSVASVTVTPPSGSMKTGEGLQLTATPRDANGNVMTGQQISWTSANPLIATVSSAGYVTGIALGTATVTATSGGRSASSSITVTAAPPPPPPPSGDCDGALICERFAYSSTQAWRDNGTMWNNIPGTDGSIAQDGGSWWGTREIVNDPTSPGGAGRVLEYRYPDVTGQGGSGDQGRCANRGISSRIKVPNLNEVWVEVTAKFSPNFTTRAPATWGCTTSGDFKFLRTANLIPGTGNLTWFGIYTHPGGDPNKISWDYPGNANVFSNGGTTAAKHTDGNWHTYRFHAKNGPNGVATMTVDGSPIVGQCLPGHGCSPVGPKQSDQLVNVDVPATAMYMIMIGATMNQGSNVPGTLRWGSIKIWNTNPGW